MGTVGATRYNEDSMCSWRYPAIALSSTSPRLSPDNILCIHHSSQNKVCIRVCIAGYGGPCTGYLDMHGIMHASAGTGMHRIMYARLAAWIDVYNADIIRYYCCAARIGFTQKYSLSFSFLSSHHHNTPSSASSTNCFAALLDILKKVGAMRRSKSVYRHRPSCRPNPAHPTTMIYVLFLFLFSKIVVATISCSRRQELRE